MDAAVKHKDGTFTLIPEGPPVEKVDMMEHLREQSTAIAAKDKLVKCILNLNATLDQKMTLLKFLENKFSNGDPRTSTPEKIPKYCEFIGIKQEYCDYL